MNIAVYISSTCEILILYILLSIGGSKPHIVCGKQPGRTESEDKLTHGLRCFCKGTGCPAVRRRGQSRQGT